jgi:hypothetical protein
MKNMNIETSAFYKKNTSIHNNLWKIYTASLFLGIVFVSVKGLI